MRRPDPRALRSGREWTVLIVAAVLLALVTACLRLAGFRRVVRLIEAAAGRRRHDTGLASERVRWLVGVAAARGPVRATCLVQALVLRLLLAGGGRSPVLVIGVTATAGTLAAHAWVELDRVAFGPPPPGYVELARLSGGGR